MPKTLRDVALEALAAKEQARADEEAAMARARSDAALARVAKSQLKKFFPGVKWEFVGDMSDGTTLVREKDGLDTVIGVTPVYSLADGETPEGKDPTGWKLGVYKQLFGLPGQWTSEWPLNEAADLGAYLESTEPKPQLDVQA